MLHAKWIAAEPHPVEVGESEGRVREGGEERKGLKKKSTWRGRTTETAAAAPAAGPPSGTADGTDDGT